MSAIWQYLTLDNPTSKTATCSVSKAVIQRVGTNVANFNTSNLIKLLKMHHGKEHDKTALPKRYETAIEHVSCRLKDVQAISFTTEILTSDMCPMSLLRLHTGWTQYHCQHLPFNVRCYKQMSSMIRLKRIIYS